ncbi:RNA/RNP complex-1-interacting phosphatase-like isoform X1 [Corapipo altera]|uniref:RNA/RNP complex-1-interacting phosphatase-like isoform X1 n=1 Tax=Corapipo altera TaxID=415028 RepID=UPI000FD64354|nr:RNA/RNP complex-1-interacting phosphatase-like isoform X1 [Corapipo altera]XP_027487704.1 RNA/RNP complex-1-interacting phosphatase-like isoform X1 [Corapipo altera]XP_027487705.1 RNA/RNP complex-1-interacting phosphatase-like isoform X1 [Corapipo altera]
MAGRGAARVPERWTDYIPLGRRMPGTRFIAFKVPLKKSFDRNLLPEERFSPRDLIRKVRERKEELGLIIDLTYTRRYYGPEELPATLCYSKILTMGHEIPNKQTIFQFKCVVKQFLNDNKDNDKLIGVHCTHGLNRTGYLVCRYLIDVEGMEPNTAIESPKVVAQTCPSPVFNKSRGHPIERTNYIQDLRNRAGKKKCGLKSLGSGPFREKSSAPANPKKQMMVKAHPPRSAQPPLAVPRNASSAKRKHQPNPTALAQPLDLGHGQEAPEQRRMCSLAPRNCWVSPKGLSFPHPQNSQNSQEATPARKRRHRRRKHVRPEQGMS